MHASCTWGSFNSLSLWICSIYSVWKTLLSKIIFSNIFLSNIIISLSLGLNAYVSGSLKLSHSSQTLISILVEIRVFFFPSGCVILDSSITMFSDALMLFFSSVNFLLILSSLFFIIDIVVLFLSLDVQLRCFKKYPLYLSLTCSNMTLTFACLESIYIKA